MIKRNKKISIKMLAKMALLAAMSIVLGKLLQIPLPVNSLRISFENLPIILCGWQYGPICGALTAVVADILGSLLKGYDINPIITIGAAAVGLASGLFGRRGVLKSPRLIFSVAFAHLAGSVIIKSLGIYIYYQTALPVLALRIPVYIATAAAEYVILKLLTKNKAFSALL